MLSKFVFMAVDQTHRPCNSRSGGFFFLLIIIFLFFTFQSAGAAETGGSSAARPIPAEKGLGADGQMQIQRRDRCPLCAMLPARYPEFSCAIQLKNGKTYYFCSPRCLLRVWSDPKRYLNISPDQLGALVVRHYFTGKQIDGRSALWVGGSDVIGPMGPAIIALDSQKEVAVFKQRHGGKRVFRLNELTAAEWKKILGDL